MFAFEFSRTFSWIFKTKVGRKVENVCLFCQYKKNIFLPSLFFLLHLYEYSLWGPSYQWRSLFYTLLKFRLFGSLLLRVKLVILFSQTFFFPLTFNFCLYLCTGSCAADSERFDADPDSTFYIDADPDSTFYIAADPNFTLLVRCTNHTYFFSSSFKLNILKDRF